MSNIKFETPTYFTPWWNLTSRSKIPWMHIEEIAEVLSKYIMGDFWRETINMNTDGENTLWCDTTLDNLPTYVRYTCGNVVLYYYLANKKQLKAVDKDGKNLFHCIYLLDDYMSKWNYKLHLLWDSNPRVKFLYKYYPRAKKKADGSWYFDFIEQKENSSFINTNKQLIRKDCYYTSEQELYSNNFNNIPITALDFVNYKDSKIKLSFTIEQMESYLKTPSNTGRYRYIVAKSSSLCSTTSGKLSEQHTSQSIIVIPVFNALANNIYSACNDFSITDAQTGAINPLSAGNNIGVWESDLPFSFLYGMYKTDSSITIHSARNKVNGENIDVPFFQLPINYYHDYILLNFTNYVNGFYGKLSYMVNNMDKVIPETEPYFLSPNNYSEVYDNGMNKMILDSSYFIYTWNEQSLKLMKELEKNPNKDATNSALLSLHFTPLFDNDMVVAYNLGDNTNYKLISLDNTNRIMQSLAIKNSLVGSASATYFENNVNAGTTAIENRKSEQTQAWVDFGLNSAKTLAAAAPSWFDIIAPWKAAAKATSAAASIAKGAVDTAFSQKRANNQLYAQFNNIKSAPNDNLGTPFIKGMIPNDNKLFHTYSIELHPVDKEVSFLDRLKMGSPVVNILPLKEFKTRRYMNILHIDSYENQDEMLEILLRNDTSNFKTESDYDDFFAWLNGQHHIYDTIYPINVLDYKADNYIDNIEYELPPHLKSHIDNYITNIPQHIKAESSLLITELKNANPTAPTDIWDDIEVVSVNYSYFVIKAKDTSTKYYGSSIKNTICYNATCSINNVIHYIYDFNRVFSKEGGVFAEYIFEDGFKIKTSKFNSQIIFNNLSSITSINDWFLSVSHAYDPLGSASIYNQPLILPNNIKTIGKNFLYRADNMTSTITINCNPEKFEPSAYVLSSMLGNAPIYKQGVHIAGTYASEFKAKYPNRNTIPVRKLI